MPSMPFFKTPEEEQAKAKAKAAEREAKAPAKTSAEAERNAQRQAKEKQKQRAAYLASPVGRADVAFDRGDEVFQYAHDVMSQQAVIIAMVGSTTTSSATDPSSILNAVCKRGWRLVNGSFVFVMEGEQSRDKLMASGQNVAVKGRTVGYYLFTRCPENRA